MNNRAFFIMPHPYHSLQFEYRSSYPMCMTLTHKFGPAHKFDPTHTLPPGLYLVATPIGNLRDITLRALDTLAAADMIACEDTRVTGKLLQAYDISKKMIPYTDHSTDRERDRLIGALQAGKSVALVSDAGTPLISDPGYKLVQRCYDHGIAVTSLPGANAPLTALQLSGLPSDGFSFIGFLPPKSAARKTRLGEWARVPGTLILFETGPRLCESLADMHAVLGDRPASVVREITKLYEEARRAPLSELITHYTAHGAPKGEIVVVIGEGTQAPPDTDALLKAALAQMSVRDAAAHVASITGLPKKDIYARALELAAP